MFDDFLDIAFAHKKLSLAAALQGAFVFTAYGISRRVLDVSALELIESLLGISIFMFMYSAMWPVDKEYIKTVLNGERHGFLHYVSRMFAAPILSFSIVLLALYKIYLPMVAAGKPWPGFVITAAIMLTAFAIGYFMPWGIREAFLEINQDKIKKTYKIQGQTIAVIMIFVFLILIVGIAIFGILTSMGASETVSVVPAYMILGLFISIVYPIRCANAIQQEKAAKERTNAKLEKNP